MTGDYTTLLDIHHKIFSNILRQTLSIRLYKPFWEYFTVDKQGQKSKNEKHKNKVKHIFIIKGSFKAVFFQLILSLF